MAHEPKKRMSNERSGKRRASISLELPAVSICKNCGSSNTPHIVCKSCGYYNGRLVVQK